MLDVLPVVDRLVGEERPLHQVHQVRADVVEPLALLVDVEEPRRAGCSARPPPSSSGGARSPCRRRAPPRCRAASAPNVAGSFTSSRCSSLLTSKRSVMMSRRDAAAWRRRSASAVSSSGRSASSRIQGLSTSACSPGVERGLDAVDLAAVAAREDDGVAGTVAQHALQEVRAGVDLELPARSAVRAQVEARRCGRVVGEVRAQRRVDVHRRRHARVHLLLHQRRRGSARVERDEADVRPRALAPSSSAAAAIASTRPPPCWARIPFPMCKCCEPVWYPGFPARVLHSCRSGSWGIDSADGRTHAAIASWESSERLALSPVAAAPGSADGRGAEAATPTPLTSAAVTPQGSRPASVGMLDIGIERWTTDAEHASWPPCSGRKAPTPCSTSCRSCLAPDTSARPAGLGWDIHYARQMAQASDGSRRIVFAIGPAHGLLRAVEPPAVRGLPVPGRRDPTRPGRPGAGHARPRRTHRLQRSDRRPSRSRTTPASPSG